MFDTEGAGDCDRRDPRRVARGVGIGCASAADGRWRTAAKVRARRGVAHVGVAEGTGAELQAAPLASESCLTGCVGRRYSSCAYVSQNCG